jgi:hypothetical protein
MEFRSEVNQFILLILFKKPCHFTGIIDIALHKAIAAAPRTPTSASGCAA